MNKDNVYLVILLVIGIVVFSNLAMLFALASGSKSMKFNWFKTTWDTFTQPFKKEGDELSELRKRVDGLEGVDDAPEINGDERG